MVRYYPQPTIVGSGLTGLLISNALSNARIAHVLIGGPPPTGSPRLGESLILEATLHFLTENPELADCYYEKGFAKMYAGEQIGNFDFNFSDQLIVKLPLLIWGKQTPNALIHIDRVRIDAALYEKAINNPHCTHIDARVEQFDVAPGTDRIEQLVLHDGETLPVSHVFDATGRIRLLTRALAIPRRLLGPTQRVVYTHYRCDVALPTPQRDGEWRHGTNILRLYRERDGFDGLAWCIPLGDTISVGVSTPLTGETLDAQEYLTSAQKAYARYGVNYGSLSTISSPIKHARIEFYTHSRAHGANWLLAGGAHTQIWWPTSSGLDTAVAASRSAVPFLEHPQRTGADYQSYLRSLLPSQNIWNWIASHPYDAATTFDIKQEGDRLYWSSSQRFLRSLSLAERNPLVRGVQTLAAEAWGNDVWPWFPTPVSVTMWQKEMWQKDRSEGKGHGQCQPKHC